MLWYEHCLARKDAILPELEQNNMTFRKFKSNLLKVGPFAKAQNWEEYLKKYSHGNTISTKMNLFKIVFCYYIQMVIIMVTRGRLAIGTMVTFVELQFNVHMTWIER